MKVLDWIILIVAVPLFLINLLGYLIASTKPLVQMGLAKPNVKPKQILFWFCAILFVVWRVWG